MKKLVVFVIAETLLASIGWTAVHALPQAAAGRGVGPVTQVKLGPIDAQMAEAGGKFFDTKCVVCHALDEKKIGPSLRQVTGRRAPEWIMNMLLNVNEMLAKDPEARTLRAQYPLGMTDQHLTQEQARQVLEYLRQVAK